MGQPIKVRKIYKKMAKIAQFHKKINFNSLIRVFKTGHNGQSIGLLLIKTRS